MIRIFLFLLIATSAQATPIHFVVGAPKSDTARIKRIVGSVTKELSLEGVYTTYKSDRFPIFSERKIYSRHYAYLRLTNFSGNLRPGEVNVFIYPGIRRNGRFIAYNLRSWGDGECPDIDTEIAQGVAYGDDRRKFRRDLKRAVKFGMENVCEGDL